MGRACGWIPPNPNPHASHNQTTDEGDNDETDAEGSTYASGDALPSRRDPSRECASIMSGAHRAGLG